MLPYDKIGQCLVEIPEAAEDELVQRRIILAQV